MILRPAIKIKPVQVQRQRLVRANVVQTIHKPVPAQVVVYNSPPFVTFSKLGKYGRIGNQLFQIAAAVGYSKKYNIPIRLPKWFCNYDKIDYSSYFINKLDQSYDENLKVQEYKEPKFSYTEIPKSNNPIDLHGYFQSELYFKDYENVIRNYLKPEKFLIDKINRKYSDLLTGNVCSIHIRRGDYVGSGTHFVCDLNYYNDCIDLMKAIGIKKFLFFSDDINWCKENFKGGGYYFSEDNNPIEDLFIMSMCKNNIISNSSFSWWASWLNENPNKLILVPSKWFADTSTIKDYENIFTECMIRI